MSIENLTSEQLDEIERRYDPETAFRPTGTVIAAVVSLALVAMSAYHFYASGFGLIRELLHRGIHLSFVLGLVFLLFGFRRATTTSLPPAAWYRFNGVALIDFVFSVLVNIAQVY